MRQLKEWRREQGSLAWLIPVRQEEWNSIKERLLYGVYRGHRAVGRMSKGDVLIFYVTRTRGRDLGGKVVGVYEAASDWFEDGEPIFPGEEKGKPIYPIRIKLKPIKVGAVDLWRLIPRLSFVRFKDNPSRYLMGTPANANRPIPKRDLHLILSAM
ncbi:MAG: EVE domain-containing protein [Thermofilaceae archaeon]